MIKKFNEFNSLNESFRDDKTGMSLSDMMKHKSSYKDGVASSLMNIITRERGISEKSFSAWDEASAELDSFYETNKDVLDDLMENFEVNNWRKDYCAEKIYAEYFSQSLNEKKNKKKTDNVPIPDDLKDKLKGVSLGKDDDGYFVYTHRARCKSYATPEKIPQSKIKFIESTG